MRKQKTKLAIFDIDGTIFRSSLVIELIHAMVEEKVFPLKAKKEMEKEYVAWLDRKGTYENYIAKVVKIYVKYIVGKNLSEVDKVAKEVVKKMKDRTYRYTRDLIKQLKKEKYFLLAISGSPTYIVKEYAKAVGFNDFYGSVIEVKNGKFTGKVVNIDSANKKTNIVSQSILKNNLNIDYRNSLAIGDTESDISILELVGHPIAFNPNLELAKYAKRKNWHVVVERKDVIYSVNSFEFLKN